MNYKNVVSLFEHRGADVAAAELASIFEAKQLRPRDFDLGKLFIECFGYGAFQDCRARKTLVNDHLEGVALQEAEGAVVTAAFTNITGQIVYNAVLDAYKAEEFVFQKLIPEVDTPFLDGEKIAGITEIGDEVAVRNESDPYALAGVGEDWIFTPALKDRGMVVPVTWEAIFADRTGKLIERCSDVGKWAGVNKEKRAIDCLIDENTTAHRYNWRGTVIASYNDNTGTHTWDNLTGTNTLIDWASLNAAEQTLNAITDPYTGEPFVVEPKHLVVTKQLEQTANRIIHATEVRVTSPGFATTSNPNQTTQANPYLNKYQVVTSRLLAARLATDTDWFLGDIGAYAKYMVAEKLNTVEAPPNSYEEFHRRIVRQFRVNERGAYVVVQPRVVNKSTVS